MMRLQICFFILGMLASSGWTSQNTQLRFFSESGQDKYVYEHFFQAKNHGVFVEINSSYPLERSNSLFFEKVLSWKGLCVNANPKKVELLREKRSAQIIGAIVSNTQGVGRFFLIEGPAAALSMTENSLNRRSIQNIASLVRNVGGSFEVINVEQITLQDVIHRYNIEAIDLLIIGSNLDPIYVLSSPCEEGEIHVVLIERDLNFPKTKHYLESRHFRFVGKIGGDDVYINKNYNSKMREKFS